MPPYTYAPTVDFFIEALTRETGYEMSSFHTHRKFEIYYEVEGTRRYFIEDSAYIVNAGNVVLIGENQLHKTGAVGDGSSSRIVCNFSAEYLGEITRAFPGVDFFSFLSEERNHLLNSITVRQQNDIYTMLQRMIDIRDDDPAGPPLRKMMLATLLLQLKKLCEAQQALGGAGGRVTNRIVDEVQSYISQHYAERLTLTDIANQFYISPYYLSRLFKRHAGVNVSTYVNKVRVEQAKGMLRYSLLPVADVACACGFNDPNYFSRVFARIMGIPPSEYRRRFLDIETRQPPPQAR